MNISDALNLNASKASLKQLRSATSVLKSSFNRSANAISRIGYETELMKTVGARIETDPIYSKPTGKLTREELQEVYGTYREAKGHRIIDNGKVLGWEENLTSTKAGFLQNQRNIARNVLGYNDYDKLSQDDQKALWDRIDDIRSASEGHFIPGNGVYGSGTNIKKVTAWINQGKSNAEILDLLKGTSTEAKIAEQEAKAAEVPLSPMDLLPDEEDF